MKVYITEQDLIKAGACSSGVLKFTREFGGRVRVTKKRAARYAHQFNFEWCANSLLKSKWQKHYYKDHEKKYAKIAELYADEWIKKANKVDAKLFAKYYIKQARHQKKK